MLEKTTMKNLCIILLCWLLLCSALPPRLVAQTLPINKKAQQHKLAPDLEETLITIEEEEAQKKTGQTLAQVRQAKTATHTIAGAWSQPPATTISAAKSNRFIVNLQQLATDASLRACVQKLGGTVHKIHANMGMATLDLPLARVRELSAESIVEYVSPDRPLTSFGHLETTTGADQIRAAALANGVIDLDGSGVGVAIIDSGIDNLHKLIRPSSGHAGIVAGTDFITVDALTDRFGHGTFIAAVAAGSASLSGGSYEGIAPNANLISLKVLDDTGIGFASSLMAAIDWCIYNRTRYNIRVINLSVGTVAKDSYQTDPLCLAVRRAHAAGILVVAAAGNEGKDRFGNKLYGGIHSPGIDPSVLTVGAANTFNTNRRSDDRVASYSSRGPTRGYYTDAAGIKHYDNLIKPDLIAPGNRIISASSRNPNQKNNLNNLVETYPSLGVNTSGKVEDRTMSLNGTSVAAPVVSGAAALLFELNPNLTPNLVKSILMYSAQPLAGCNTLEHGAGLLNIDGAVRIARLVRANPTTLANGNSMLISSLPFMQTSIIALETCPWGQSVITNYCFLYGSNLMTLWQGMYSRTVLLTDATKVTNGTIVQVPGLTSSGVFNSGGVVFANGGSSGDDRLLAKGVVFADGVTYASGVVFADGKIAADSNDPFNFLIKPKVVVTGD